MREADTNERAPSPGVDEGLLQRRELLRASLKGTLRASLAGSLGLALWRQQAQAQEETKLPGGKAKHCIVLYMAGGMAQTDTFDPKGTHRNAGPLKTIKTSAKGLELSELLPQVAQHGKHLAVIRSMATREGAHDRARHLMHTGYAPSGTVRHPDLGSLLAQAHHDPARDLPAYVHINGTATGAGFIGVEFAPFGVTDPTRPVANLSYPPKVDGKRFERRRQLLSAIERRFRKSHPGDETSGLTKVYSKADRLMHSPKIKAFSLADEASALRDAYGRNAFGQGCLMARRLTEAGVPAVEVVLGGWDTHMDNFTRNRQLAGQLDAGLGTLLRDLEERKRLEQTLILVISEFGRTPRINDNEGRDHWANGWSVALAGGGVRGGQAIGATSADGLKVAKRPVLAQDLMASVFHALGINPDKTNFTKQGRPLRAVDKKGKLIRELFAG